MTPDAPSWLKRWQQTDDDVLLDVMTQQRRPAGLCPAAAQACRWHLDTDRPGGYILTFPVVLPLPA